MKSYALQILFARGTTVKTPECRISLQSTIKLITTWRQRARQRILLSSLDGRFNPCHKQQKLSPKHLN